MEKTKIALSIILIVCAWFSTHAQTTGDSLEIFFIGNKKGEKFNVYLDTSLLISFTGTHAYKHSIKIPRMQAWETRGQIIELNIYRKGKFGLSYKMVGFGEDYERDKKYLILWRAPHLKKFRPFIGRWSNEKPILPQRMH
jgi:hypothetical protein